MTGQGSSGISGFTKQRIDVGDVSLSVHRGGRGPALLLIHGYPQNHMCWAGVAPELSRYFDVIVPDLRGYGDSDAPENDAANTVYSKRTMAADLIGVLDALGLEQTHVLGHDRGARVTYRMALDHPARVGRVGIIEVVPTGDFWDSWTADIALKAYHWTFLAQPYPLPEKMIGADPEGYIDWTLASWTHQKSLVPFSKEALAAYRAQAADPARIHAMCSDYRAGATTDRAHDRADRAAGRKLPHPLHFMYAQTGFPAQTGDPASLWQAWCDRPVTASSVPGSGHFVMEEAPRAVLETFVPHFRKHDPV
jgi:haloacetate dehalogenase